MRSATSLLFALSHFSSVSRGVFHPFWSLGDRLWIYAAAGHVSGHISVGRFAESCIDSACGRNTPPSSFAATIRLFGVARAWLVLDSLPFYPAIILFSE